MPRFDTGFRIAKRPFLFQGPFHDKIVTRGLAVYDLVWSVPMRRFFSSLKHFYCLCKQRLGVGSWELGARSNGIPGLCHKGGSKADPSSQSGSVTCFPSTLHPRFLVLPHSIQVSSLKSHSFPTVLHQLPRLSLGHRITAFALTFLLFLTSSPILLAQSARSVMAPTAGGGGRASASNLQNAGAASAALTASRAREVLAASQTVINRLRALQSSARGMMQPTPFNGLELGGLEPHPAVAWEGAKSPVSTTDVDGTHLVEIVQEAPNAYLYWNKFNVGSRTKVNFNQDLGGADVSNWIAFNRVLGAVEPSRIYGSITANGQVYIMNQNGIIFHKGSQVSAHTLVASTLPINDNLAGDPSKEVTGRGLLNNTDYQFLFSALKTGKTKNYPNDGFDPLATSVYATVNARSSVIEVRAGSSYSPGDKITGAGIPDGAEVVSVNRGTRLGQTDTLRISIATTSSMNAGTALSGSIAAKNVGSVEVEPGASITSPTSAAKTGGRVMLVGASVVNSGTISTPDGQAILAAGLQVGISAHSKDDPSLRGLDIIVGRVADDVGNNTIDHSGRNVGFVQNAMEGLIESPRGSIVMAGRTIKNGGGLESSTSVAKNGRIDLMSSYNAVVPETYDSSSPPIYFDQSLTGGTTGELAIESGGVVRILPEYSSQETIAGSILSLPSVVSMMAQSVTFASGSILLAPGANKSPDPTRPYLEMTKAFRLQGDTSSIQGTLDAGIRIAAGSWVRSLAASASDNKKSYFLTGSLASGTAVGSITINSGAVVSAAGSTEASSPLERNLLTLQLRGPELADSPLQRLGKIRGVNITIDSRIRGAINGRAWMGTPLGDATGFAGLVDRTVGELTIDGGSISLYAGDKINLLDGSLLDVSGGWLRNLGGYASTTKLLFQGHLMDISRATPDRVYDGIYKGGGTVETFSKWGVTKTYKSILDPTRKQFQPEYIQGGDGGSLKIQAPLVTFDGDIRGAVVNGPRQISSADLGMLSSPSALTINLKGSIYPSATIGILERSFYKPDLTLASTANSGVTLDPALFGKEGFGKLVIENREGSITLPASTQLSMPVGGSIALTASRITVDGSVMAPSGSITLDARGLDYFDTYTINSDASLTANVIAIQTKIQQLGLGKVILGSKAVLSTAGSYLPTLMNEELKPRSGINGGAVAISGYDVFLNKGSEIDVSGGIDGGAGSYGNAGSITISAGSENWMGVPKAGKMIRGGQVHLDATMKGYAGGVAKPGTLNMTAAAFSIGEEATPRGVIKLNPEFFNTGGFGTFILTGAGIEGATADSETPGIFVGSGVRIAPAVASINFLPNGSKNIITHPAGIRRAASLTLNSTGVINNKQDNTPIVLGKTIIAADAVIDLEPSAVIPGLLQSDVVFETGALSLNGKIVSIDGMLHVPGGQLSITGGDQYPVSSTAIVGAARTTVHIGPGARISSAGEALELRDPFGYGRPLGVVIPGGSISISGNIQAEPGSLLDVSGSAGTFYLASSLSQSHRETLRAAMSLPSRDGGITRLESSGGTVQLIGNQFLASGGVILGAPGGETAQGGTLRLSSGRFYNAETQENLRAKATDINLTVFNSSAQAYSSFVADMSSGRSPMGYVSSEAAMSGGFDHAVFGGNVSLQGNEMAISMPGSITIADGAVLSVLGNATLRAPYVSIGAIQSRPLRPSDTDNLGLGINASQPTGGNGSLNIVARNIDVGNLLVKGTSSVRLTAQGGVIRGGGTVSTRGSLEINAAAIYPRTATRFSLIAYDKSDGSTGSITIRASGTINDPQYSAGGYLSLDASSILVDGTLMAPFGSVRIGWNGDGTAPNDPVGGSFLAMPVARNITLGSSAVVSISGIDHFTGSPLEIPYGLISGVDRWTDPTGEVITATGPIVNAIADAELQGKQIKISGLNVETDAKSTIDLRGGGDLIAYQWIKGLQGSIDIMDPNSGAFAIIANYNPELPPESGYAKKLTTEEVDPFGGDVGFVSKGLMPGDKVTLAPGAGFAGGTFTLLPSRYAILPGAMLVRPTGRSSAGYTASLVRPDGVTEAVGYRENTLVQGRDPVAASTIFQVYDQEDIRQFAEYNLLQASEKLPSQQSKLPTYDAGKLSIAAIDAMRIQGSLMSDAGDGGRRASVQLSSSLPFSIKSSQENTPGKINLSSPVLSSWKAGSLLIGGTSSMDGMVAPRTQSITVDNAGSSLSAGDLVLASANSISLLTGSSLSAAAQGVNSSLTFSGNGSFVRLTSASGSISSRTGYDSSVVGSGFDIGDRVQFSGYSLELNSSSGGRIAPGTVFDAKDVTLSADTIAVNFNGSTVAGAVNLSGGVLTSLADVKGITLNSYTKLQFQGTGALGNSGLALIDISTPLIQGDNLGSVKLQAGIISFSGGSDARPTGLGVASGGKMDIVANLMNLGSGYTRMAGFRDVSATISGGILGESTRSQNDGTPVEGGLGVEGNVVLTTPLLTMGRSSASGIFAGGALQSLNAGVSSLSSGLGASLILSGSTVDLGTPIRLPGGSIVVTSSSGDIRLSSKLEALGNEIQYFDSSDYVDGGTIRISANNGDLYLNGSEINVSAAQGGGNSGSVALSAPDGAIKSLGILKAVAANGDSGSFSLDVKTIGGANPDLDLLETRLVDGGFTKAQDIRIRNGDISIGKAQARSYTLSADAGNITVRGEINASGSTGGSIALYAGKSLTMTAYGILNAHGAKFMTSGKGGEIVLEAGGNPDFEASSSIDLAGGKVDLTINETPVLGDAAGTLYLRAPQIATGGVPTGIRVNDIQTEIVGAGLISVEGFFRQDAATYGTASIDSLSTWQKLPNMPDYLPGQSVLMSDGNVYKLTADPAIYSEYKVYTAQNAGGFDVADTDSRKATLAARFWTKSQSLVAWNEAETYSTGNKVLYKGSIYTAMDSIHPYEDQPGAEISSWALDDRADGNWKQVALNNASDFMSHWVEIIATLSSSKPGYRNILRLMPGEEIVNSLGGLKLNNDWDFSTSRYGDLMTLVMPQGGRYSDTSAQRIAGSPIFYVPDTSSGPAINTPVDLASIASEGKLFLNGVSATKEDLISARYDGGFLVGVKGDGKKYFTTDEAGDNRVTINPSGVIVDTDGTPIIMDASGFELHLALAGASPGQIRIRARGDLTLLGSLSDGFGDGINNASMVTDGDGILLDGNNLYFASLLPSARLSDGSPRSQASWSITLAAGSDLSPTAISADPSKTVGTGSVLLGRPSLTPNANSINTKTTANALNNLDGTSNYQVIRTGTGNIQINSGGDILLRNQFASIYTAGTVDPDQRLGVRFDLPEMNTATDLALLGGLQAPTYYPARFSLFGGDIELNAGRDMRRVRLASPGESALAFVGSDGNKYMDDSSRELPVNWLSRRGVVEPDGSWLVSRNLNGLQEVNSTAWWINYANFFEGVGALAGGEITMQAGRDIRNFDALIPTQGRLTSRDGNTILDPSRGLLVETGGGNLSIRADRHLDAGVYYVENGDAQIRVGGSIVSNRTRDANGDYLLSLLGKGGASNPGSETWLPTSFLLGRGSINVQSRGSALLGPIANAFLLPASVNNGVVYKTYFSTYDSSSSFSALALGDLTFRTKLINSSAFSYWLDSSRYDNTSIGAFQPWLRPNESSTRDPQLALISRLLPSSIRLSSLRDMDLAGDLLLSPDSEGSLDVLAGGAINGVYTLNASAGKWAASTINVSDASASVLPSVLAPASQNSDRLKAGYTQRDTKTDYLSGLSLAFNETASTTGNDSRLESKLARHDQAILHQGDTDPVRIYSMNGGVFDLQLFSPKKTMVLANGDIRDIGFYIQHVASSDRSLIAASGSILLNDPESPGIESAKKATIGIRGAELPATQSGDIMIAGPGSLAVTAGGDINFGTSDSLANGTGVGITSVGNAYNPALPFRGADVIVGAGLEFGQSLGFGALNSDLLLRQAGALPMAGLYFKDLKQSLAAGGETDLASRIAGINSIAEIRSSSLSDEEKAELAMKVFYIVLKYSGRDFNNPEAPTYRTYKNGSEAIATYLGSERGSGDITLNSRDIRTKSGGSISIVVPGGELSLARFVVAKSAAPPGIITENSGNIQIFTENDVSLGIGRVFTLRGGDIMIWSDKGDIAAGSSAKTVASAPPTRVAFNPLSADVLTDLAGIATGGGIGALATVEGVALANIDLIAPTGVIDAGDAGIRATGNLNLAATRVLNANNISVGGKTSGAPAAAPPPAPANVSGATAASSASAANNAAAQTASKPPAEQSKDEQPSVFSIDILGYGGGDSDEEKPKSADSSVLPVQASL